MKKTNKEEHMKYESVFGGFQEDDDGKRSKLGCLLLDLSKGKGKGLGKLLCGSL